MDVPTATGQRFKFNPERTIDDLIKTGVQNTFMQYSKSADRGPYKARNDIAKALQSLANIIPPPKPPKSQAGPQSIPRQVEYFSAVQRTQVEIFMDIDTDTLAVENLPVYGDKNASLTEDEKRNDEFRAYVADWISKALEVCYNPIAQIVLTGVYSTLVQAEDTTGPFVEQFEKHIQLLKQLATIYKRAEIEDLDSGKGAFSFGIAVEEGLRAVEAKQSEGVQENPAWEDD